MSFILLLLLSLVFDEIECKWPQDLHFEFLVYYLLRLFCNVFKNGLFRIRQVMKINHLVVPFYSLRRIFLIDHSSLLFATDDSFVIRVALLRERETVTHLFVTNGRS